LAGRKFGEFGKSQAIHQTNFIQISTHNYNLSAESIHLPNFFRQMLKTSKFTKLYSHQTFLLYGIWNRLVLFGIYTTCHSKTYGLFVLTCEMATNAMITHQYKWPPNDLYVYLMKLKYGLEDSLWYSEPISIDLNV